jgi:UDP-N-acetylmuramyl pentapeptide phosphotransferase/UDP-N-acetylglucosamine-1-phosphate transferase
VLAALLDFLMRESLVMATVAPMAAAAIVTLLACYPLRSASLRLRLLDKPGERSSHSVPTPRTGGLAIIVGAMAGILLCSSASVPFLLAVGLGMLVAIISLLDDVITIPSLPRLAVHLLVAGGTIWLVNLAPHDLGLPYMHLDMPWWLGIALATLFTVGYINFFNFMDGINGIAACQAIIGGLTLAVLLALSGAANSIVAAAAIAGAAMGFLPHNFPKARMFMGDVGSTTLGFVLAMLTLVGGAKLDKPWVAFMMPLGVFIYDAGFTLIKRISRRENFLKPHREHHYQLLIRCGWSHARVTGIQAGLMAVWSAGSIFYIQYDSQALRLAIIVGLLAMMAVYSVAVHRYFARRRPDAPQPAAIAPAGETA